MNYAAIKYYDIANGSGVRVSLFVSGCRHQCKGCFNAVAWDFTYGDPFTELIEDNIIKACEPDYISGLSILGGEPLDEDNLPDVWSIVSRFKHNYPDKSIWIYTGYTFEQLMDRRGYLTDEQKGYQHSILWNTDILVDGPFIQEQKDISLQFRGSKNQRIIDLKQSMQKSKIVLKELTNHEQQPHS